jgi:hypothetical protein
VPQPFVKFFFKDWEGDRELMECSLSARGLWMHMLRVMHEAEPYGFFVGRDGAAIDLVSFARHVGATPRVIRQLIGELDAHSVFSRDALGRIFSRRMVRDFARYLQSVEFGRDGGNPALRPPLKAPDKPPDKPPDKAHDKPPDKGGLKSRARQPESRIQNPESRLSDSLRSSAVGFGAWPQDIEQLRALALLFVAAFANCRDPVKAEKHVGAYAGVLASMRSRGVPIEHGWQAFEDALAACGGRPLWGAAAKSALSFLPSRPPTRPRAEVGDSLRHMGLEEVV